MMGTLSREDLQDLFPGPENFLRRKAVWRACQDVLEVSFSVTHHLLKLASSCFCSFCYYFFCFNTSHQIYLFYFKGIMEWTCYQPAINEGCQLINKMHSVDHNTTLWLITTKILQTTYTTVTWIFFCMFLYRIEGCNIGNHYNLRRQFYRLVKNNTFFSFFFLFNIKITVLNKSICKPQLW